MHPDQERWDPKHRRWCQRGDSPEPHQWMTGELEESGSLPVVDLASGISAVPDQLEEKTGPYFALDVSPVALRQTRRRIRKIGIRGGVCQADLERTVPLVPLKAFFVLTFFYSPFLFRWVAEKARPGSRVIVETYCMNENDVPISEQYCLDPGELQTYYEDWTIVYYGERRKDHPETARLIAEK